jgi:fido (protein-threonine AMPylation protein)
VIEIPDDDPVRQYTPEEERLLTEQLFELTRAVHAGESRDHPLDLTLLRGLHAGLFQGVRDHAGRNRARGFGSERLTFGPHRSVHRDEVERELEAMFRRVDRDLRALKDAEPEDYELQAIRLAIRVHAEIIWIHPFEDGNGRTGRLCASHVLVQLGLRPVAVEAVKQEYTEALNHYFLNKDIDPLVDLYLRLYPIGR